MAQPAFSAFELEELLSRYEQGIDFHFAESGVDPLQLSQLLTWGGNEVRASLDATALNYPEVNGNLALRQLIADRYPGARPENVLVTAGASEANFILAQTLLAAGDRLATVRPTYMQIWGIARNMGVQVDAFDLCERAAWALDTDSLAAAVQDATKMVAVVNPNNPTGAILGAGDRAAIIAAADRVDAWLLADEVYSGAERSENAPETPSFWGQYEKVIAVGSTSKAYGLPGLRTGWIVAPETLIEALWRRHEYVAVSGSILGQKLAEVALSPRVRPKVINRTRALIRDGFDVVEKFVSGHGNQLSVVPPQASAMCFIKTHLPISSAVLCERLRIEKSILIPPGELFESPNHLRFSSALPADYLAAGLQRFSALLGDIGKA